MNHPVDPEIVRRLLDYDPDTGLFTWRERPRSMFATLNACNTWNTRFAGRPAMWRLDAQGYHSGKLFGRHYKAHRLALCIINGRWPSDEVDHMNLDRADNRLCNLREASRAENMRNRVGGWGQYPKGVRRRGDKFSAVGTDSKGKRQWLGTFTCPTAAAIAYNRFCAQEHAQFARPNG